MNEPTSTLAGWKCAICGQTVPFGWAHSHSQSAPATFIALDASRINALEAKLADLERRIAAFEDAARARPRRPEARS